MSEWKEIFLEDIADEITVGFVGSMTTEYTESGVPFLRSKNVEPYRINWNDIRYISQNFHKKIKKSALTPDDVVIVRTGNPGAASLIPESLTEANCSDLVIVRPGEKLDKKFLVYYLNSIAVHYINSYRVGAVQQHFNIGAARKLKINLPPIEEQKQIADILSCLDNKIDNLRRQNETLEKIAQTLFKHWFIDFEFPNDEGKPYKSSGGAMVTSEFGNIPAGWHIACLDEYVNVINGYSYKGAELLESDTALINLKNFDRNGGFRVDGFKSLKTDNYKKQHIVFPDDLIVAHTDLTQNAEVLGNAVLVQPSEKYNKYILSMDLVKLESKKDFLNNFFFYYLLSTREFKGHCVGYSNGTTVLHLSKKAIPEYTFPISDEIDIISNFQNIAYVARKKITNNTQQIQTLTKTRETLLPKLMSGQVRVKE